MDVLFLCAKYNIELPDNLLPDLKIGSGIDGEVYSIKNSNLLIKCVAVVEHYQSLKQGLIDIYFDRSRVLSYLIENKPHLYVSVYKYGCLGTIMDPIFSYERYLFYYYIMERLSPISDDEFRVFHTILSHEDSNKVKNYTDEELNDILLGLSYGLDFDFDEVLNFYYSVKNSILIHEDLHPRNIMRGDNCFKLIDVDRVSICKNTVVK